MPIRRCGRLKPQVRHEKNNFLKFRPQFAEGIAAGSVERENLQPPNSTLSSCSGPGPFELAPVVGQARPRGLRHTPWHSDPTAAEHLPPGRQGSRQAEPCTVARLVRWQPGGRALESEPPPSAPWSRPRGARRPRVRRSPVVLKIHVVRPGGHLYYVNDLIPGRAEGSLVAGESPGVWSGDGAAGLGMNGTVDATGFGEVLDGRDPRSGRTMREWRGHHSVSGYDLSFCAAITAARTTAPIHPAAQPWP
jgi:hypothetical protein